MVVVVVAAAVVVGLVVVVADVVVVAAVVVVAVELVDVGAGKVVAVDDCEDGIEVDSVEFEYENSIFDRDAPYWA